ncbi:MAG: hypothetical protein LC808_25935, partial [Actinobacteria bacterium]|nr:hypothetical protein [Actinomycetota bacterium]
MTIQSAARNEPTVTAGTTLTYVVSLTNPTGHPINLKPCPRYIQSTPVPNQIKATYALNCRPVEAIRSI